LDSDQSAYFKSSRKTSRIIFESTEISLHLSFLVKAIISSVVILTLAIPLNLLNLYGLLIYAAAGIKFFQDAEFVCSGETSSRFLLEPQDQVWWHHLPRWGDYLS